MNNIIDLISWVRPERKGKCIRTEAVVSVVVVAVAAVSGLIVSMGAGYGGGTGFWGWLTGGAADEAPYFITDKAAVRLVDLKGDWRFFTGDGAERAEPGFDDSSWAVLQVPGYWENQGYDNYDGYAWYRREFSFSPAAADQPLYLFAGRIDDVDEIFINGRRVGGEGRFPPHYVTAWDRERVYRVPEGVVREGANVIAIRVYDGQQGGGVIGKQIGLYTTALPQPMLYLDGNWKFAVGNNPDWKNQTADESDFGDIPVPSEWEAFGYDHYDGHAWYRKTFGPLDVSDDETLVLFLGKIDDTDEVFLNGERIGSTGEPGLTNAPYYKMNREYGFPASLLKETNTLAVHVHDGRGRGGIYSGPLGIMTKTDYLARKRQLQESRWRFEDTVDWLLGRE